MSTAGRILVTPRSVTRDGHPALEPLRQAGYEVVFSMPGVQPDESELLDLLPGCIGYLAGVEKVSAGVLEAARDLKVISRNGTGIDNIDLPAAERLGIQIVPAAGANARGVAELAIGLMLSLARSLPWSDAGLKAGQWQRRKGIELEGKVLGLIGCGRIGRLVARMASGLDMRVVGFDPFPPAEGCGIEFRSFDDVLAVSDILSLHCPACEVKPLIDADAVARMKKAALLINAARASLIDPLAVMKALESGQLAGFATDVFENEPPGDDPLLRLPNVIATPHIGALTAESIDRAVTAAVNGLLAVLAGGQPSGKLKGAL